MTATLAAVLVALSLVLPARAGEVEESVAAGHGAWRQGRPEEAARHYRYALNLQSDRIDAAINLALVLRDLGQVRDSVPLWLKAGLLSPSDPFFKLGLGWSHASVDELDEARAAFEDAAKLSTTPVQRAEALLGLAMVDFLDRSSARASARVEEAFVLHPYWLGGESHLLGLLAAKDRRRALVLHRQALEQDPMAYEALLSLARIHEKVGDPISAYQSYHALGRLSAGDPEPFERATRLEKFVRADPAALVGVRRIAWPQLKTPETFASSASVTLAAFADDRGRPTLLTGIRLIANADFKVVDERLGASATGKANTQWEIRYSPERDLVELRDNQSILRHASKQPLEIVPFDAGGSILLKSAEAPAWSNVDPGDREFRGTLSVRREGRGFVLFNSVGLEPYLASVVALALPQGASAEAQKAVAVAARTEALRLAASKHVGRPYGLCDDKHCLLYRGVSSESKASAEAVKATTGQTLAAPEAARLHAACGGRTESGVQDSGSKAWTAASPWELELRSRSEPPEDLHDQAARLAPSTVRWFRILDADDLERRMRLKSDVGGLKALTPLGRTESGRARTLRWTGTFGSAELDADGAQDVLSPGSLRSMAFVHWPLYDGERAKWLLVWGVGSGHGEGLCRAGTIGLASLGKSYKDILAHYFPGIALLGEAPEKKIEPQRTQRSQRTDEKARKGASSP